METIFYILQDFHLNCMEVLLLGTGLFACGFVLGKFKASRLQREKQKLEREVLDLNAEVLYWQAPRKESTTPVIGLKLDKIFPNKTAN